jgi:hypothetical protein
VLLSVWDASRKALIYFRRPPERDSFYGDKDFPDLAVRDGKWKFLQFSLSKERIKQAG